MWHELRVLNLLLLAGLLICTGCSRSSQRTPAPDSIVASTALTGHDLPAGTKVTEVVRKSTRVDDTDDGDTTMPSQTDICNADPLLLSVYDFDVLYGTPLPKACCSERIKLKEQWRCELDWPASDVPSCASLTAMAKRLHAFIDSKPKWYTPAHKRRAVINVGRLRSLSESKGACVQ